MKNEHLYLHVGESSTQLTVDERQGAFNVYNANDAIFDLGDAVSVERVEQWAFNVCEEIGAGARAGVTDGIAWSVKDETPVPVQAEFPSENWTVQDLGAVRADYPLWHKYCIRAENNVHLATVGGVDRFYEGQHKAIAHLMAGAPKLLAALIQAITESGYKVSGPSDSRAAEDGEPIWVCVARGAIANAQR